MKFFRTVYKYLLVGIMGILLIAPIQVLGLDNGYARIVYNVSGLQNYQLHWNDRFPPGSLLSIYSEADGVNHKRAVGVDYIFIIKDADGNIIDTATFQNRYQDFRVNDFVTYSRRIDESWDDGAYIADIHIFDLLNDSLMQDYYADVTNALLNQNGIPDVPYMNRSNITNSPDLMNTQHKEIIQNFYIDKYADKYPANRFMIENLNLDRMNIAPGEPVLVGINITNNFYDSGSVSINLVLDNNPVNKTTINVGPFSSKNISMTIPSEITSTLDYGNYAVEIIPTSNYTIGFNLSAVLTVIKKEIEIPIQLIYKDIQTDKLKVNISEPINITVTIQNTGRVGSQPVGILINNVPVEQKTVGFNALATKDVNFMVTETEPGEYRITANNTNLSKIFFVQIAETAPVPIPKPVESKVPNIFIVVGLSVLLVFVYIIRKNLKNKLK